MTASASKQRGALDGGMTGGGMTGGGMRGGGMRGGGGIRQLFDGARGSQIAWLLPVSTSASATRFIT